MGNEEYNQDALLAEYNQTCQDHRHRTTVEMTILSVFFATSAGLIVAFSNYYPDKWWIGLFTGIAGISLAIGVVALIVGERRAWSADITRLKELETVLSGELQVTKIGHEIHKMGRFRYFEHLWSEMGYQPSKIGSFSWYIGMILLTSLIFGCMLGMSIILIESTLFLDELIVFLFGALSVVIICYFYQYLMSSTLQRSKEYVKIQKRP